MAAARRVLSEPEPVPGRAGRLLRDGGALAGTAVQLLMALLGAAVVSDSLDHTPDLAMLAWCLLGTGYAVVMLPALWLDSRRDQGEPPSAVQANRVVRWVSLLASLISGLVGLVAAFMVVLGDPDADTKLLYKVLGIWAILVAWAMINWGFVDLCG